MNNILVLKILPILIFSSSICYSMDWVHLSETYKGTYYVNYDNIKRSEDITLMIHMIDYPRKQVSANGLPFYSELITQEYRCDEPQIRLLQHNTYSGRKGEGKIVYPRSWHSSWTPVVAGTLKETLWRIACDVVESDNVITDYDLANPIQAEE